MKESPRKELVEEAQELFVMRSVYYDYYPQNGKGKSPPTALRKKSFDDIRKGLEGEEVKESPARHMTRHKLVRN